jgi:hypothetical protein
MEGIFREDSLNFGRYCQQLLQLTYLRERDGTYTLRRGGLRRRYFIILGLISRMKKASASVTGLDFGSSTRERGI